MSKDVAIKVTMERLFDFVDKLIHKITQMDNKLAEFENRIEKLESKKPEGGVRLG